MPKISEAKIAILATHGFEQSELEVPLEKLKEAGAEVHVISPDGEDIKGWDDNDWGRTVAVDKALHQAIADHYDALVLPGGQMNPDILRVNDEAMSFIKSCLDSGKTVAAICHAPWLLVEAGVAEGREMTGYKSIKTDLVNAGAEWQDVSVVADQGIVTSRNPGDLDDFVAKIIEEIEEGTHVRDAA